VSFFEPLSQGLAGNSGGALDAAHRGALEIQSQNLRLKLLAVTGLFRALHTGAPARAAHILLLFAPAQPVLDQLLATAMNTQNINHASILRKHGTVSHYQFLYGPIGGSISNTFWGNLAVRDTTLNMEMETE